MTKIPSAPAAPRGHDVRIPDLLYGTAWKEERTRSLTAQALRAGFRGIDTANQRRHYDEAAVGAAVAECIRDGIVARTDLFLQTKFTYRRGQDHRLPYDPAAAPAEQVRQSFASSLEHLQTTYIDSYVLHGPESDVGFSANDWEVWRVMESLCDAGAARLLGVSNVSAAQLAELCAGATVLPTFVQNRCYARMGWDHAVRQVCQQRSVRYQGFSLLTANAKELERPAIQALARRLDRPLPAVVYRFAQRVGMLPLTGTSRLEHMADDLACGGILLSDADLALLEGTGG